MTEQPTTPPLDRDALRKQFLSHAGAAFDLLFHPDHQADLVTFDQREARVVELMRDLGAWVLQRQANTDPDARGLPGQPAHCPRCNREAILLTGPDDPLEPRKLTTLIGGVELQRCRWKCTTCRVVFFPPRPQVASGHGRL